MSISASGSNAPRTTTWLGLDPLTRASLAVDQMTATAKLRDLREQDLSEGRRLLFLAVILFPAVLR